MMRIDIISVVPALMNSFFEHSICARAAKAGLVEVVFHDLHDYSEKKHKQVDDYPFGGGAGMVMAVEPLAKCIETLKADRNYNEIIYFSPDGIVLKQGLVNQLSLGENLLFICGHYKGIDERIRELAAAVTADAIIRLIPGAIGDESSALTDSFQDGLLAPPVYTRPASFEGMDVPAVLLSGHEKKIEEWRHEQAVLRTQTRRPDLLD
jgi:tRNA (guanine37-N1)-methyltransferase